MTQALPPHGLQVRCLSCTRREFLAHRCPGTDRVTPARHSVCQVPLPRPPPLPSLSSLFAARTTSQHARSEARIASQYGTLCSAKALPLTSPAAKFVVCVVKVGKLSLELVYFLPTPTAGTWSLPDRALPKNKEMVWGRVRPRPFTKPCSPCFRQVFKIPPKSVSCFHDRHLPVHRCTLQFCHLSSPPSSHTRSADEQLFMNSKQVKTNPFPPQNKDRGSQ